MCEGFIAYTKNKVKPYKIELWSEKITLHWVNSKFYFLLIAMSFCIKSKQTKKKYLVVCLE